jgi:hypothetical protein
MDNFFRKLFATFWKSDRDDSKAEAVHASNGNQHAIFLKSLRVIIVKDGDMYFAQSMDISYAASGDSLKNAQDNFERGLSATLKAHLEAFGNIDQIMQTPPAEEWANLLKCDHGAYELTTISQHTILGCQSFESLPYTNIEYLDCEEREAA